MIHSPHHIYLSNTICVLSHRHTSAHIHTHAQTWAHAQIHLSREQQGQEVCGLIERPHGATVTLNVQVFIRVSNRRCKSWLCYSWCNLTECKHMENILNYSFTIVTKDNHNQITSHIILSFDIFNQHSTCLFYHCAHIFCLFSFLLTQNKILLSHFLFSCLSLSLFLPSKLCLPLSFPPFLCSLNYSYYGVCPPSM